MLWEAVPTALAAAFSPAMLLIVTGLLGQKRPIRNASVFLATAATVTLAVGIALLEVLQHLGVHDSRKHRTVSPTLDIVLGAVILAFGAMVARRPPAKPKAARQRDMRLLVVIGLGLFMGSPSPLYVASVNSVAKGNPGTATGIAEIVVLAAIVLLLAEVPIIWYLVAPERTAAGLKAANDWLARHGRTITLTAAAVVGVYLIVSGVAHLV